MMALTAAAATQHRSLIALHLWHGIGALAFLAVMLGGIGLAEWWQRRNTRRSDNSSEEHGRPKVLAGTGGSQRRD